MITFIGDIGNPWNVIVVLSVVLAAIMWLHSELLRYIAHRMTTCEAGAKEWTVAADHLRWALRLNRTAHMLGILAVVMQQIRIESVRKLAVETGAMQATSISLFEGGTHEKTTEPVEANIEVRRTYVTTNGTAVSWAHERDGRSTDALRWFRGYTGRGSGGDGSVDSGIGYGSWSSGTGGERLDRLPGSEHPTRELKRF